MEHFDARAAYEALCRPVNARLMRALGLDVVYERAWGDQLACRDANGDLLEVTDFVGGYGATLFGHHHPAIDRAALSAIEDALPFAAQGSVRAKAAELAQRLHDLLRDRLGLEYSVLFASTGTEAVEMALKHAEMRARGRDEALLAELDRACRSVARAIDERRLSLDPAAARVLELSAAASGAEVASAISDRARAVLSRAPRALIALEGGFHGKTVGSLALTHYADYREPFERLLTPVWFVPPNDVRALARVVEGHRIAVPWPVAGEDGVVRLGERYRSAVVAMFAEPMQGEGGVRPLDAGFLQRARALADEHAFELVLDEIQCGMGRTGTLFYSEQLGVRADAYLLSKSLGGGLAKISAFLVRRDHYDPSFALVHTSTFAEDDPSSAVALAALSLVIEGEPLERAQRVGEVLRDGLSSIAARYPRVVREVRGTGLMLGVELAGREDYPEGVIRALAEQDRLGYALAAYFLHEHRIRVMPCISAPRTLRLEPSAYLAEVSVARFLRAFEEACAVLERNDAHALLRHLVGLARTPARPASCELRAIEPEHAPASARAGFIGYFIDVDQMPKWDASLARFTPDERRALIERVHRELEPSRVGGAVVRSARGTSVELRYYGLFVDSQTFYAHLRGEGREAMRAQVERATRMAKEDGCTIVGFGGLTSVVTSNCRELSVDGVALTTGNSLTVAMCLEAARREASAMEIELSSSTAAVVGAGGNIGSVYALAISDEVERVVLVGREGREAALTPVVHRIYERAYRRLLSAAAEDGAIVDDAPLRRGVSRALHRSAEIRSLLSRRVEASGPAIAAIAGSLVRVTSDLGELREASLVLGASNAPHALVHAEHLGEGRVLVVDVAVPGDAHPSIATLAPRVRVITGGAVDLGPQNRGLVPHAPLADGHLYACATETAVLALEGRTRSFSVGAIRLEQVEEIAALAREHGFTVARGSHASALAPLKASA